MKNKVLKVCPINRALKEMKVKSNTNTFKIVQFTAKTGVDKQHLMYHRRHPNSKWTSKEQREKMEEFFRDNFDGKIIADHKNQKMWRVKK